MLSEMFEKKLFTFRQTNNIPTRSVIDFYSKLDDFIIYIRQKRMYRTANERLRGMRSFMLDSLKFRTQAEINSDARIVNYIKNIAAHLRRQYILDDDVRTQSDDDATDTDEEKINVLKPYGRRES